MYISGSGSGNNSSRISRCISVDVAVETIVAVSRCISVDVAVETIVAVSRCISVEVAVETIVAELVDVYQWKWQWKQ